jgi:hypothetical protein
MKITTFMVQTVRKHVLLSFAGGPVEKFKHTRNKFHKDEAQFFMKYRVSETVISLNKASLKNSLSGKMLTRNQCRADEFRRYNTLLMTAASLPAWPPTSSLPASPCGTTSGRWHTSVSAWQSEWS